MKTYIRYEDVPKGAQYLGAENGDGTMYEELANAIENALEPVQLIDAFGVVYFEVAQ